jgi:hypothetical protein
MATITEQELITRTVLDYFQGWFEGDVRRMERALHPQLAKHALKADDSLDVTTAAWMIDATAEGRGKRDGVEIDVEVVEIYGDIATAIVRSTVYREYLHLVRTTDGWKIANALWQKT